MPLLAIPTVDQGETSACRSRDAAHLRVTERGPEVIRSAPLLLGLPHCQVPDACAELFVGEALPFLSNRVARSPGGGGWLVPVDFVGAAVEPGEGAT